MNWKKYSLGLLFGAALGHAQAADFTWNNGSTTLWSAGSWSGGGVPNNGVTADIKTPSAYGRADLDGDYTVHNFTFGVPGTPAAAQWQIVPQNVVGLRAFEITGTLSVADNGESTNDLLFRNTTNGTLSLKINEIDSSGRLFFGQNETSVLTKLEVTGLTQIRARTFVVTSTNATFGEVRLSEDLGVPTIFRVSNYRTNNSTFGVTVAGLSGTAGTVHGANAQAGNTVLGTLKINTAANTAYSFSGTLVDGIGAGTNKLAVVKTGSGTQSIGGAQAIGGTGTTTYSGGTQIQAGTLLVTNVSGNTSALGSGAVSVSSGARLGGNGFISLGGANTISVASGGAIAPGTSLGTLTLNGIATTGAIITLDSGAYFQFELGAGNTSDRIDFWNYAGSSDFVLNNTRIDFTGAQDGTYTLFRFYSDDGVTAALSGLNSGFDVANFTGLSGFDANFSYGASSITLTLTSAVPEPGAASLLVLGALALVARRPRKSK